MVTHFSSSYAWEESPFEWHLFGTLGFSHTDNIKSIEQKNVPYSYVEPGASLKPLSKLALQGSYNFSEKLDFTVQAVARGYEDFEPEVEWVYLKYALLNDLNLRIGRIRRPLFMHSDSYNVAYTYPWSSRPGLHTLNLPACIKVLMPLILATMAGWEAGGFLLKPTSEKAVPIQAI